MTSTADQTNRQSQHLLLKDAEDKPDKFTISHMDHVATASNNLPHMLQRDAAQSRLLYTEVFDFTGSKVSFLEFDHLFLSKLQPHQHRITWDNKLQYFQSFWCDEVIELRQTLRISPETNLRDALDKYHQKVAKNEFRNSPI